jgi:hypothetical protein
MKQRVVTGLSILALAAGVSACGAEPDGTIRVGETEGVRVNSGPLQYQVQISRILNPSDPEDSAYLKGIADPLERELGRDEEWFGVFLRVNNRTDDQTASSTPELSIVDTTGERFEPVEMDAEANPLVYRPQPLGPKAEQPDAESIARSAPTQGSLVLFKIPRQNLENRPLVLDIEGPGEPAEVDLDV